MTLATGALMGLQPATIKGLDRQPQCNRWQNKDRVNWRLPVTLRLEGKQLSVLAALSHEFCMGTLLDH